MIGIYDIVRAITDYGVQTVICVWFLYWVYFKEKKNAKRDEQILNHLLSLKNYNLKEEQILNEETLKKERHLEYLKKRKEITPKINLKLHDMVTMYDLNRASIFEFHNSNENLTGFPFAKYSCNFESIKKGMQPMMKDASNIPYSSLGVLLDKFHEAYDDCYVVVDDLDILEETGAPLYQLFKQHDINHIICFPLYDINNNSFGFVLLEYADDMKFTMEDFSEMKEYVAYFNSILDNNNPKL